MSISLDLKSVDSFTGVAKSAVIEDSDLSLLKFKGDKISPDGTSVESEYVQTNEIPGWGYILKFKSALTRALQRRNTVTMTAYVVSTNSVSGEEKTYPIEVIIGWNYAQSITDMDLVKRAIGNAVGHVMRTYGVSDGFPAAETVDAMASGITHIY